MEKVLEEFQRLPRFPRKMVFYSSTNFHILRLWAIVSNLTRFHLGFWQASKTFYRKLKYPEKAFEEFQRFVCFPRIMVLYSSTNFCILEHWAIICNFIRFGLGFWQGSKSFYSKLKFEHKVFEELLRLLSFPRKIFLYSSTNFRISNPWAIIWNLIRLDLGFCPASTPFYIKIKHRDKVLEQFQRLRRFPRKMVLHSSTNFHILMPGVIISNLIRFDLGSWQTLNPF